MSVSWIDPAKQRITRPPASYTAFLPGWCPGIPSRGINTESLSLALFLSWLQYTLLPACALSIKVWDEERMSRCPPGSVIYAEHYILWSRFSWHTRPDFIYFYSHKKEVLINRISRCGLLEIRISFLLRKANAMRSDWNDERQDTGVLACLNGFVPNRLFCKSCYDCMSI